MAAGYKPGQRRSAADRLHGRHLRSRSARHWSSSTSIHVNCGSPDMIDQLGERAPGPQHHAADQSRLRPRPQPEDQHRRRAIEARHLARAARRLPAAGPTSTASSITGLHMHIGAGTDLEHLAQVCGAMEQAARDGRPHRSPRSAPAAACRCPIATEQTYVDLDAVLQAVGRDAASGWKTQFGHESRWRSSRAATSSPKAATWSPRSARSSRWAATRSICSTPASTTWPGRSCTAPIIRCRSCPAERRRRQRPAARRRRRRPAVRIGRHLHAGRRRLRLHARACPRRRSATTWSSSVAGAYGFVMGSNYNSKPLAAEVLIQDGQPHLIRSPADVRRSDSRRGDSVVKP